MKPIVILLTGQAKSGKDTSADYLVDYLSNRLGISTLKIALADRLKIICQLQIKKWYGIEIPLEDFYDQEKKEQVRGDFPQYDGKPFKLRNILQDQGSEVYRDCFWHDIWCDYVAKKFLTENQYRVVIISDARFPNEFEYFEKLKKTGAITNVITCRLLRPKDQICHGMSTENQMHQSEQFILTLPVQFEILNHGTKEDLYQQLHQTILDRLH